MAKQQKTPAAGFLIMAGFNMVAAIVLFVFYFPYSSSGGEGAFYFLLAGGVLLISSIALFILYGIFKEKIERLKG